MKKLLFFTLLLLFFFRSLLPGGAGSVWGLVSDEILKIPVANAKLMINIGYTTLTIKSLPNGYYSTFVPEGTGYIITVQMDGYKKKTVRNIDVRNNGFTEVNIALTPDRILTLALKGANGKYVCADLGLGGRLVCNRTDVGPWEKFKFIRIGGTSNTYAIIAANGKFVCHDRGQDNILVANRSNVGEWERFRLFDNGGVINLLSSDGKWLTLTNSTTGELKISPGLATYSTTRFARITY